MIETVLPTLLQEDATAIARAIRRRTVGAKDLIQATLAQIERENPRYNCFTDLRGDRALAAAAQLDRIATPMSCPVGALAGVPFAVKNLFDLAGMVTVAGSRINRELPPAVADATVVERLQAAGAIAVGALNMDEYAYGFVTENSHYGATPNPYDPTRIAGGSSGGSAAAVAAGLVPMALGTDTNGSVRVPAALCGVYGFKPTYGLISRAGTVLFAPSLDHVGMFTRSVQDLAIAFELLQGPDPRDPVSCPAPPAPCLRQLEDGLSEEDRLAVAGGYFASGATPDALAAVDLVVRALGIQTTIEIPEAARARAAAYTITAAEGAAMHLPNLRSRPMDFDPATRDRFLAGALIPAAWYQSAQRFRRWYRDRVRELFREVDLIVAPTTPTAATLLGQKTATIAGEEIQVRPELGRFTQPLSFIGLPVLSVPVWLDGASLPLGVQLIAAPYQETRILRAARVLEREGIVRVAPVQAG